LPTVDHNVEHKVPALENAIGNVKAHVKRHKVAYTVGGVVVVVGVAYYVGVRRGSTGAVKATNKAYVAIGDQTINITTVIKRDGRGHPGYPVMNLDTKEWWPSAHACAKSEKISETLLAGNLQGKNPHVNGKRYSWFSLVPTPTNSQK